MAMGRSTSELCNITWPEGKAFAFTIFDDTDGAFVDNVAPLYEILTELGFRTTKTAWPLPCPEAPRWRGDTCGNPEYFRWVKQLQADGFEIGYHMASCVSSERARTQEGIEQFKKFFGKPQVYANHYDNLEAIYWGDARLSGLARWGYMLLTRFKGLPYKGHLQGTPYFWGDLCLQEIEFVRNFVFRNINTLKKCPYMPYRDPARPYVKAWYASSDASDGDRFFQLLSPKNQEQLERERGACIVYTHLARNFMTADNVVRPHFRKLMTMLSKRNGWFVPAGQLLRYIRDQHGGDHELTPRERRGLEWSWLCDKVFLGGS
jgi:hypothetical protein